MKKYPVLNQAPHHKEITHAYLSTGTALPVPFTSFV